MDEREHSAFIDRLYALCGFADDQSINKCAQTTVISNYYFHLSRAVLHHILIHLLLLDQSTEHLIYWYRNESTAYG